MPVSSSLHELATLLHDQGLINLDTHIEPLVMSQTLVQPLGLPTDIIVGPRYILATLTAGQRLSDVSAVASDVRVATDQKTTPSPPQTAGIQQVVADLGAVGLINLKSTLRTLGAVTVDLRDAGPAMFIHQNYVFIHVPGAEQQLSATRAVAGDVNETING